MAQDEGDYLLGTSEQELARLGYQHQVWREECSRLWQAAGFAWGQEIVDLGCGPGFATLDLAHLVGPHGRVHGVDASEKYLSHLEALRQASGLTQVTTHRADATDLPLESATVDGVFARWLLCFLQSPVDVLREAARVLRPGGSLAVFDYFNYLSVRIYPWLGSFRRLFECFHDSVRRHGGSYDVGETLPALIDDCGLELESLTPCCRIARPGSRHWIWFMLFVESHVPSLVEWGILSREEEETIRRDLATVSANPSAFLFAPPLISIAARKPR